MITGLALFGVSYVVPAIIAAGFATQHSCHCGEGLRMLIPIAGPLTFYESRRGDYMLLNTVVVIDTVLQSAGLLLSIIGIVRFIATAPPDSEQAALHATPTWSFDTAPLAGGAYASLVLRL
jgi:hypothetical protein